MTPPPELHDLIDPDANPEEQARLERTHELLVAAGPPPAGGIPEAPRGRAAVVPFRKRPRLAALSAVAAAVLVAVGAGYLLGARGNGLDAVATVPMHGVAPTSRASADLAIGSADENGNVPIEMRISGLPQLPRGGWYELYLSKDGKLGASCGTFQTAGPETTVRLSVGYTLADWHENGLYDGWVVTAHVPGKPASGKQILLTT
jgi:hypothetical protein